METQSIRITDTVAWLLDKISLPNIGPYDVALAAIKDLTAALDSLAKASPATAQHRQLHDSPSSLLSDLTQFVKAFYPPGTSAEPFNNANSADITTEAEAYHYTNPLQRIMPTVEDSAESILQNSSTPSDCDKLVLNLPAAEQQRVSDATIGCS